jgi:thioredoxin 1
VDEDAELAAIRARLRDELVARATARPAVGHPVVLEDATFDAFVAEHGLVVVDCWAPWCGPCRIVDPIVEELAREWAGRVAFGKLDVDENPRVSRAFDVMSIPTLLVFRGARLVDAIVGALPKPALVARIQRSMPSPAA